MRTTILIHTENLENLRKIFLQIREKNRYNLILNAKDYAPWDYDDIKKDITSFNEYDAMITFRNSVGSLIELIYKSKTNRILILNDDCETIDFTMWNGDKMNQLYCDKSDILKLNLDTKYQTITWFLTDLISQKSKSQSIFYDNSNDYKRYMNKVMSPLFTEKIIHIDGGLGDHIMALPLLEKLGKDIYISCKYPFVYEHLRVKGHIDWNDDLFGGYSRFVYDYGSINNSPTIIDAFFNMYGLERDKTDMLKYNGKRDENFDIITSKKIALICTSAAKINDQDSNKDWRDIRWFKLVHELQKRGYYVIQVGSIKDNQIPIVDYKFLDRPISNLASLIEQSSLWITVDTFFHHFASAINPTVGICLTPYYNNHAKHFGVLYVEKDCGKNYWDRRWWMDLQQPERKECMDLIMVEDVLNVLI